MATLLAIPVSAFVVIVCLKVAKSMGLMFVSTIGRLLIAVNSIIVAAFAALAVSGLAMELTNFKYWWAVGIAVFIIVLGLLGYYSVNLEHPIVSYLITAGYGVADGYFIGGMIVKYLLPKFCEVSSLYSFVAYALTIICTVSVILYGKRTSEPTGFED